MWVADLKMREASPDEGAKLHRVGEDPVVATMTTDDGVTVEVAAAVEHRDALLGPFFEPAVASAT